MEAFFLPMTGGDRLCVFHSPVQLARGAMLFVHGFAEEMNLSRHMVALQARALADAGYAVLQIDLFGCGDSAGDFGDATWSSWIDDVLAAAAWLRSRADAPLWFWGLRAGCLLAVQTAARSGEPCNFLLWQPVLSGETHWRQFLRIRTAAEAIGGDREDSTQAGSVEVAGYRVAVALSSELALARLDLPKNTERVVVVEVASGQDLSPALAEWVRSGEENRRDIAAAAVAGAAFWQTPDAPDCAALLEATSRLMGRN
jgi:exosortase A-associated hydrolase 2